MHQKGMINITDIEKSLNAPLVKDQYWYIIDKKWFDTCRQYNRSGDENEYPGPIDNSALFAASTLSGSANNLISKPKSALLSSNGVNSTGGPSSQISISASDNHISSTTPSLTTSNSNSATRFKSPSSDAVAIGNRPLKSNLSENEDFLIIPEQVWNLLEEHYTVRDPSHVIKRRVIENNPGNYIVEIYPLNLLLCLHAGNGTSAGIIEKQFSRISQLKEVEEEMRKLFNIDENSQTKLWVGNNTVYESDVAKTNGNSENWSPNLAVVPLRPHIDTTCSNYGSVKSAKTDHEVMRPIAGAQASNENISVSSSMEESSTKSSPMLLTLHDAGLSTGQVITIEYRNIDGIWPSCKPRCGSVSTRSSKAQPGLCGLSNIGNTCFMNSALQCLSNTPPLTNYIMTDNYVNDINVNNPLGMHGEIAKTYADLIKNLWSGSHSTYVPREFKLAVGRFAPQFSSYSQQDCQELMAFLLDGLHEDLNRIREKPYIEIKNDIEQRPDEVVASESWSNYRKRNDSIVVDTFHALLKSTLVCPECELVSVTFDPFCYLSLPLPVKREKQIELVYVPAPRPLDSVKYQINNNYDRENNSSNFASMPGCVATSANECRLQPIQISKFSIPKSGPASEICQAVAKTINQYCKSSDGKLYGKNYKVNPDDLVVAEIYNKKFSRVYESTDHYSTVGDEFIVYEKGDKYCIPMYLRERKNETSSSGTIIGNVLMLHVPNLKYETIYKAMLKRFRNPKIPESTDVANANMKSELNSVNNATTRITRSSPRFQSSQSLSEDAQMPDVLLSSSSIEPDNDVDMTVGKSETVRMTQPMETDELVQPDRSNCHNSLSSTSSNSSLVENGTSEGDTCDALFRISIVNSSGSSTISQLKPGDEAKYNSKLYLAAEFQSSTILSSPFSHLKPKDNFVNPCDVPLHVNILKEGPKPTLQLEDCITQFTNVERLGADDPWYCPKCKKHQQATKKFDIWSLPKILIIHLKRFSFSRSWRDKIDTMVEFPIEGLDLSEYVLSPDQKKSGNFIYDLIAVANHYGGLGGGHYTAYAKNVVQGSWFYFDDAIVTASSADSVISKNAYVLFYQQRE